MIKSVKKLISIICLCLVLCACSAVPYDTSTKSTTKTSEEASKADGETKKEEVTENDTTKLPEETVTTKEGSKLEMHFVDVGQGDCILIKCDNETMLIDTGMYTMEQQVLEYLDYNKVSNLKYVIATHPDLDHIGNLPDVLTNYKCSSVIMPDIATDTYSYTAAMELINKKDINLIRPIVNNTYTLGSAKFTIIGPAKKYEEINDNSVVIVLEHGDNRFLLSGDAEETAEADILNLSMDLDVDLYKLGHHGSNSSSTKEFLEAMSPEYAVISCGEGNEYYHPHQKPLNELRTMNIKVFRTDEQGSIIAYSDGTNITFNCSPSESWLSGQGPKEGN